MKLLDTTYIIDLLRNDPGARKKAVQLDEEDEVFTTEINVFEVVWRAGSYCSGIFEAFGFICM